MIKGCEKRIVFLNDTGSIYFEEAYFIVKPSYSASDYSIIEEATRIADGLTEDKKKRGRGHFFRLLLPFFCGALIGAGIVLMGCFLF